MNVNLLYLLCAGAVALVAAWLFVISLLFGGGGSDE